MNSYQLLEWGKPLQLRLHEVPVPQAAEVLVKIEAAGVWRALRGHVAKAVASQGLDLDNVCPKLMRAVSEEAERSSGKVLPINATGAIGALCCEMGFDWKICRGLGVMARAVGLVGHILEETRRPMAAEIWHSIEAQATAHIQRPSAQE